MEISREDIKCARKLSGELGDDQDGSMFEIDLLLDEGLKDSYQDYKQIWDCYPKTALPLRKEKFAQVVQEGISRRPKSKRGIPNKKIKTVLAAAAVVLLGVILHQFIADKNSRYTNHIIASTGHRKHITLPDGSIITLNSGSELKYPEDFGKDGREVWVKGEAYFNIVRDVERPFRVKANGFVVRVLGTKFNIRDRGRTKAVSLESGRVQVTLKESGDKIQLNPNEELTWDIETGEIVKRNFDVSKTMAWKDNILFLDNLTLKAALVRINEFYGVEFVIVDSTLADKNISAAFEDQDLDQFVQTLEFIADVKISPISRNKYSIVPSNEN